MLVVWLPLTGDLHNQGLGGPLNFTTSGTITDVDGKIGKAKHFSSAMARATYNFTLGDEFSFSAWIYWDSFRSDNEWIIELGKTSPGYANALFGFNTTKGNGKNTAVAIGGNYVSTLIGNFETKQWFHVAVTWNGLIVKLYSNGVLIDSASLSKGSFINSTNISLACNVANSSSKFTGSLNDVRIYNHCLSDKEIEEITKGLVLHYPLNDRSAEATTNLVTGFTAGSQTTVSNNIVTTSGTNADTYFTINLSEDIVVGTQYTLSCYASVPQGGEWIFPVGTQSNSSIVWKIKTGYNEISFVANNISWGTKRIFMDDKLSTVRTLGQSKFYNFQLEKKDHATAFVEYGQSRIPTTIFDTSGYSNNGTIVGDLSAAAPSPRYAVCTAFNKNSYIKNIDFSYESNQRSVSLWYFKTTTPSGYESLFCFSKGNGGDSNKKMAIIPNSSYIWFKCESGTGTLSSVKVNEWTHIVLTSEGKVYENGIEVLTISPGSVITGCTDVVIGARAAAENVTSIAVPFEGKISDVRIYSTALTAAQVTELYNQSMIVDASGNVLPRELVN